MILYLASDSAGRIAGLSGLIVSAVGALLGAVTTARVWRLVSPRRGRELEISLLGDMDNLQRIRAQQGELLAELDRANFHVTDQIVAMRQARSVAEIEKHGTSELVETESARSDLFEEIVEVRKKIDRTREDYTRLANMRARMHIDETNSLFSHARIAFYSFLGVTVVSAAVLLYGAYLAIYGHLASGVIVALSSAIPGGFSAGLYRISSSANRRAASAFAILDREVEREAQAGRILNVASTVNDHNINEGLRTLAALRAVFPDASAGELASLLNVIQAQPVDDQKPRALPDDMHREN